MKFRRFKKQRKPNFGKALVYIIILLMLIYFWTHAEDIIGRFI